MPSFLNTLAGGLTASAGPAQHSRPKRSFMRRLEASAKTDGIGEESKAANAPKSSKGWQKQAWHYYDNVGELHYAAGFVGAALSRCSLIVGIEDDKGHVGPVFDENGEVLKNEDGSERPELARAAEALELVRRLKSEIGGQPQLLRSMGINLFTPGEFYLVGNTDAVVPTTGLPTPQGGTQPSIGEVKDWEVLSTEELVLSQDGKYYERFDGPGAVSKKIATADVHVIRVWRSHPRFSNLPDSSVSAVRDTLEELMLLTQEVRAQTRSRLANTGLLLVPEEIAYENDENDDGEDDAFAADLIETMSTAVSDKSSAAGLVPFVLRAPAELLHPDKFRFLDLATKSASDAATKRAEAVLRFAQGVDLPVEIVTGHGGTTFANAISIDDALYKTHVEPVLEIIVDALTVGYLRPAMGGQESTRLRVYFDSSELVARPNRSQDAKDVYDKGELSGSSLRNATGFSDSDAPSDDELERRAELKRLSQPAPIQAVAAPGSADEPKPRGTPPAPGAQPTQGQEAADDQQGNALKAAALLAAMEVTVDRAVERAGSRLRSRVSKDQQMADSIRNVGNYDVARTLGVTTVGRFATADQLFHDEFRTMARYASREFDARVGNAVEAECRRVAALRLYDVDATIRIEM